MKTWGGRQLWGDLCFRQGYRIQRHIWTSRCRLLDRSDECIVSGTYEACCARLDSLSPPQSGGSGVILLHGILRTSKCFVPLGRELETAGYEVFPVDYPSTRILIEQAAEQLQQVVASLQSLETIHFVCHSMGGLILRAWFGQYWNTAVQEKFGRAVMLGTPNNGAELADWLRYFPPYRLLFGKAGLQLGIRSDFPPQRWPLPAIPTGIVAGGRGPQSRGYNLLLPGDNDGTVTVASTHLPDEQEADFIRVPALHMNLMRHPAAMEATLQFLHHGAFAGVLTSAAELQ